MKKIKAPRTVGMQTHIKIRGQKKAACIKIVWNRFDIVRYEVKIEKTPPKGIECLSEDKTPRSVL